MSKNTFAWILCSALGIHLVACSGCSKTASTSNGTTPAPIANVTEPASTPTPPEATPVASTPSEANTPTAKPAFYTVDHYDTARNPADDLAATIKRATAEKKNILVQVGGDWCGWCKLMSKYIETNEKVRDNILNNYLVMKVTYTDGNHNEAFLSQYPAIHGYPHIFVLDSSGKLLHSQDTSPLEKDHGYNEETYLAFLNQWKPQ
jgi:hypothetical protein